MAKTLYAGVSGVARKAKKIYIGDTSGKARKVKKMYIGDNNGKARLCWSGGNQYETLLTKKVSSTTIYRSLDETPTDFTNEIDIPARINNAYVFYHPNLEKFVLVDYLSKVYTKSIGETTWTALSGQYPTLTSAAYGPSGNYVKSKPFIDNDGTIYAKKNPNTGDMYKITISNNTVSYSTEYYGSTDTYTSDIRRGNNELYYTQVSSGAINVYYKSNGSTSYTVNQVFSNTYLNLDYLNGIPCIKYYNGMYYLCAYNNSSGTQTWVLRCANSLSIAYGSWSQIGSKTLRGSAEDRHFYFFKDKVMMNIAYSSGGSSYDISSIGTWYFGLASTPAFGKGSSNFIGVGEVNWYTEDGSRLWRITSYPNSRTRSTQYSLQYTSDGYTWTSIQLSNTVSGDSYIPIFARTFVV